MSLFTRLSLHFLAFSILPLALVGGLAYQTGRQTVVDTHLDHLQSTNRLKRDDLNRWVDNGTRLLVSLAQRPLLRRYASALATQPAMPEAYAFAHDRLLNDHLLANLSAGSFVALIVVRSSDGQVVAAHRSRFGGPVPHR